MPQDADELVKGTLYQCAMGHGRTSAKQMIDILSYRFSEKFNKDMEKWKVN